MNGREVARQLRSEGLSFAAIGKRLSKSGQTIRRWCDPAIDEKNRVDARKVNPSYNQEKSRQWREDNRERKNQQNRDYYELNKPWFIQREAAKRAQMDEEFNLLSPSEQKEILALYAKRPDGYHCDHIWPIAAGGIHHPVNIQYLPGPENLSKNKKFRLQDQALLCKRLFNIN